MPEANLEMKKLKTEKKKIHRKLLTGAVKDVEAHWKVNLMSVYAKCDLSVT